MRILLLLAGFWLSGGAAFAAAVLDSSGYLYDPADRSCDGFPRLRVATMPGTCLGLVIPRDRSNDPAAKRAFSMPRALAPVPGTNEFLLTDMGGWQNKPGTLFWLRPRADGSYETRALLTDLDRPHGLRYGPGGYVYLGEANKITRFRFSGGRVSGREIVVAGLPRFAAHRHPLTEFAFDPRNDDLYINSGAPSDNCYVKENGAYSYCPEVGGDVTPDKKRAQSAMAALYRVPGAALASLPPGGVSYFEVPATGLRNSLALVVHSSGNLLQGENGRDFRQLEEPYEEINLVPTTPGEAYNYGWPYCYNAFATSPEWRYPENAKSDLRRAFGGPLRCDKAGGNGGYRPPYALMPPHVAPLHMNYLQKPLGSLRGGELLVSWHGRRETGQRLVAYPTDAQGRPLLRKIAANESFSVNRRAGCPGQAPFRPTGGVAEVAPYTEVISSWALQKGVRPAGAPVGFAEAADGSLWIAEDLNRTVVRLARYEGSDSGDDCQDPGPAPVADPQLELLVWRNVMLAEKGLRAGYQAINQKLTTKYCAGCHDFKEGAIRADEYATLDYLVGNQWIEPRRAEASKLYQAITREGERRPMPPDGEPQFHGTPEGDEILRTVKSWIDGLPGDVTDRTRSVTLREAKRFRVRAGLRDNKECGAIEAGAVVAMDPRPRALLKAEGWLWQRVYVLPGDSRLFKDACPYPTDGAFYVNVKKL